MTKLPEWITALLPHLDNEELVQLRDGIDSEIFKRVVNEVERDMQADELES